MTDTRRDNYDDAVYCDAGEVRAESLASINLSLAWLTIRRWWFICGPAGVALAALGCATIWMTFEPVYESIGYVKIEAFSPYLLEPQDVPSAGGNVDRTVRTQIELLRNEIILDKVLERKEIASMPDIRAMSNPARELRRRIKVASENESEIYAISYLASDPANACNLVNGVLDEYIKYQDEDLKGRNRVLIKLLDDEATDRLLEVTSKRNLVRQLAQELPTGMLAPEMGPEQMVQQADANELAQQLAELEFDRTVLRATIASMEQTSPHSDTIVPETVLDEIVATDEEVQRLSAELKYAQDTLQGIREGSTLAEQQQRKINQLEAQLKKWSEQLREEQRIALRRRGRAALDAETNSKIDQLRAEMTVNESMTQLVREKLNVYQAKIQGASSKIVELEIARRDLNRAEDVYDRLNQRINDLRTENRAPARVNLVRKATVPRSPVELIPWKQLMAVSLATFALPFAVALLWEFRSQRVAGVGEIQGSMRLPVLAEITCLPRHPRLPHRNARESYDGQRAAFENSIHYLSRNLLLTLDSNNQSVFAVTSAVSGEGKTNLASVLSISMAIGTHESVLLIDADLRRPNTHTMFDLDLSPGLADVLTENCNDDDAIHATPADGVFVMPAGQLGKHPHSVLRSDRFAAVLERVRTRFRYVIVDTPPVLSVGETLSVCKLVDAVILSTMRDVSRRNQVEEAYNRLCGAGASVCGVVLNGVAVKSYASRYGDYYFTS